MKDSYLMNINSDISTVSTEGERIVNAVALIKQRDTLICFSPQVA